MLTLGELKMLHAALSVLPVHRMRLPGRVDDDLMVPLQRVFDALSGAYAGEVTFTVNADNTSGRYDIQMRAAEPHPALLPVPRGPFMHSPLSELLLHLAVNRARSAWAGARSVREWLEGARDELHEALIADIWSQTDDLAVELGDVLWNVLSAMLRLEEDTQGRWTVERMAAAAVSKLRRRKPWIFDSRLPQPSGPEEERAWVAREKAKEPR